jgi:hypothetical protein
MMTGAWELLGLKGLMLGVLRYRVQDGNGLRVLSVSGHMHGKTSDSPGLWALAQMGFCILIDVCISRTLWFQELFVRAPVNVSFRSTFAVIAARICRVTRVYCIDTSSRFTS